MKRVGSEWERRVVFFLFLHRSVRCHPSFSENKYFIRLIVAFYAINVLKKLVASERSVLGDEY